MDNLLTRFIAKQLNLVPKKEADAQTADLRTQLNAAVDAKLKAGIDQKDRPKLRATFLKGYPIPADKKVEEQLKAYTGWVYTCVSVISEKVADVTLVLKKRISQDEFELVDTHPVLDLLFKVNPLYTSYLLFEATQAYLELTGECYWWLAGSSKTGIDPKEIWVLRPDWVSINDSEDKLIESISYGPPGLDKKIKIPWEQIVPFKDFNPLSVYRGYGTVKAAAKTIDTDNFAEEYNRMFFNNDARPGGALETDSTLNDADYDRIRNQWDAVHRGTKNAWKVAILEAGLKWSDIGLNHRDMQFIEGRKATRDEILAMFRVPKSLIAVSDDVNLAAIKEHLAVFLGETIDPKLKRFVTFLNEFLLPRYGDSDLFFDYENMVPEDDEVILTEIDNGLRHGWLTRNEARDKRGLEPVSDPGADSLYIPFSLVDIGANITEADKAKAIKKALAKHNVRIAPYSSSKKELDTLWLKVHKTVEKYLKAIQVQKMKKALAAKTKAEDAEIVEEKPDVDESAVELAMREKISKALIQRTDTRETEMRKKLLFLFNEQKEKVLSRLSGGVEKAFDKKDKARISTIADVSEDNELWFSPLMDLIKIFVEGEGILQIQELVDGVVFYMATEEVKKFLKKDGARFIPAVNEETSSLIRQELADGVDKGESIPKLRDRIEKVYADAAGYRAERIARTEVLRASNFATEEAYRQSGVVSQKEWLTAHDERVCPWCGPKDGTKVDLDSDFAKKGDTIVGTNESGKKVRLTIGLSNVSAPPLHPNCRCTLIPVLSDNKKMSETAAELEHDVETFEKEMSIADPVIDELFKEREEERKEDQAKAADKAKKREAERAKLYE